MQLFSADAKIFLEKFKKEMFPTKVEKTTSKSCLLMAAPPAQNSLEVHFRFTNSPIHSSVLKSVIEAFFSELTAVFINKIQ